MKRHLSPLDYSSFYRGVVDLHGEGCWACRTDDANRWKCHDRSMGFYDAHHLIAQRTLRRELDADSFTAAVKDPRNGVLLGRYHHSLVEHAMCRIELPPEVWAFGADWGLVWAVERMERMEAA